MVQGSFAVQYIIGGSFAVQYIIGGSFAVQYIIGGSFAVQYIIGGSFAVLGPFAVLYRWSRIWLLSKLPGECRDYSLCCICKEEGPNILFSVNSTEIW